MVRAVFLTLLVGVALLVAPGRATADPLPTTTRGSLRAVTCASETVCVAVGDAPEHVDDEEAAGLADNRDATGWHPQHIQPSNTYTELFDVACGSATSCLTVGESVDGGGEAATWNGSRWTLVSTPRTVYQFRGVACPSAATCIAVGVGYDSPAVAATWNGAHWAVTQIPGVAGARSTFLQSVACPTTGWCMAVGQTVSSSNVSTAVSAVFNGTAWTLNPVPSAPAGAATSYLYDVVCRTRTFCMATGGADGAALAEVWNGTSWTRTPVLPDATGATLSAVSCPTPTACLAVGSASGPGPAGPVAAAWNGSAWTPTPPTASVVPAGAVASLRGVSCTRPNRCVAVGEIDTAHPRFRSYTVAERWTGTRWIAEQS